MSQQQNIDEISVASDRSSRATNSSENCRLPGYLLKELAELIEENGGIQGIKERRLSQLIDLSANDIYGLKGGSVRKQIRNKIDYWKTYHKQGTYDLKVLKVFGVQSYETRRDSLHNSILIREPVKKVIEETKKKPFVKKQERPPPSPDSSKSSSESDSTLQIMDDFKKLSLSKEKFASPPAKQILLNKNNVPETPLTPATFKDTEKMTSLPQNTTMFDVDPDFPEKTFPLIVYTVDELYGLDENVFYKGFSIMVEVDPRWEYDDGTREYFSARIMSSNSVLVSIPSMPYDLYYKPKSFKECGDGVVKAMDVARNKIFKHPERLMKNFLLTFRVPNIQLSTKEIYKESETELELQYPSVTSKHSNFKEPRNNQFAVWNVVRIDVESQQIGRPDTGPKVSKATAARLRRESELKSKASNRDE